MCSARILCRLRLHRNHRNAPRQPIKAVLQEAVSALGLPGTRNSNAAVAMFLEKARDVMRLTDSWANHQTESRLGDLVDGIYNLRKVDVEAILRPIPNRLMAPSAKKNLLNIVKKVARYREASRFLFYTARRIPIARQMKTVLIDLPPDAFERLPVYQHDFTLHAAFAKLHNPRGRQWQLDHICRLLKTSTSAATLQFSQQTRKTIEEAKIHAEIQILSYCISHAFKKPPRVICSSKDACYLCNAFLLMHGKVHIPRCHGRIYPGWRLPQSMDIALQARFNQELGYRIESSLMTLLSTGKKLMNPDPNESTLLTLAPSASTLHSISMREAPLQRGTSHLDESNNALNHPSPLSGVSDIKSRPESSVSVRKEAVDISVSSVQSVKPTSSIDRLTTAFRLNQGEKYSRRLMANNTSPLYSTGGLAVQIGYSVGPSFLSLDTCPGELI